MDIKQDNFGEIDARLRIESTKVRDTDFRVQGEYLEQYDREITELKHKHRNVNDFNSLIVCWYHNNAYDPVKWTYDLYIFNSTKKTKFTGYKASLYSDARMSMQGFDLTDKSNGHIRVTLKATGRAGGQDIKIDEPLRITYFDSRETYTNREYPPGHNMGEPWLMFSSLDDYKRPEFVGYYPNHGFVKEFVNLVRRRFKIIKVDGEPSIPWPDINPIDPPNHQGGQEPTPIGYKLHLYVDNLTMGQLTLCRPQLEVGTVATDWKPNPNDTLNSVNETVKVITDKVTAIETKVGEIELQVKDNKTTITTIQSDVTKKITEQDNKIASIELKNNSITSTVEDVKNKTTELEGKVTDQAEQIKRVEQQITPEGIQSVVQDKITQAKNEAVQEANNSTDTKLEQYTLKDNFTKFKQDSEKFQLQVSQTGVTNILKNSRPRNFNKDFWYIGYNFHTMYRYFDGTDEATSHENFEGEVFKSGLWFTMWAPTVQNGWLFLANNSIRDYKFNLQKKYTIDFLLYSDNSHTNIYLQVADDNGANQVFYSGNIHLKNGYNRLTYTFTPKVEGNQPNFMIVVNNRNGEDINMYVPWVNFYEGYPITKQHLPDGRGLVDSLTTIDKDGIKCNFGDGTWASMGRQGFAYYTQGMTNPYKYINFTTKLTGIRNGHWVAITLPPCFTRKNINTDFVVQAWAGAIDSNAFAKHQQDAVRNLFIEVGSWNNETRQLFVRPCLQKIGIATKTLFGWDQATTSRGNPIGEGTVDIIVLVQM